MLWRTYTGPMMALTMLLLLAFIFAYAVKVGYWSVVNRSQDHTAQYTTDLLDGISHRAAAAGINQSQMSTILPDENQLANQSKCLNSHCKDVPVWQLALGIDRGGWYLFIALSLLVFNVLKAIITIKVVPMREEEVRSGFSPAYRSTLDDKPWHEKLLFDTGGLVSIIESYKAAQKNGATVSFTNCTKSS